MSKQRQQICWKCDGRTGYHLPKGISLKKSASNVRGDEDNLYKSKVDSGAKTIDLSNIAVRFKQF